MELFDYIKSQLPSMPNVAIMKDMGASDELIEYIRHTTWNTNLGMLGAYGCEPSGEGTKGDCDHTELGSLMYCGGAGYDKSEVLIGPNVVADGVSPDYTDAETWIAIMDANCMKGVFGGNVITPTIEDRIAIFGDYVIIRAESDAETGKIAIVAEQNTSIEHYALYTNYDLDLGECRY